MKNEFYEQKKFEKEVEKFHKNFEKLMSIDVPRNDLVHMFPIFTGHLNLGRFLSLYEIYKMTLEKNVLGHIADVGTWKGASFFFFIKLIQLFEPRSITQVHGFDWFKGMKMTSKLDNKQFDGMHTCSRELVEHFLDSQELDHMGFIHNVDLSKNLGKFMDENKSLMFKIVFLDCGSYVALKEAMKHFWPRLSTNGIMIFDHVNDSSVASETIAIREFFGDDIELKAFPFSNWPAGYIIKK